MNKENIKAEGNDEIVKPKPPKERTDLDLLELVCQLHIKAAMYYDNKEMLDAYIEARKEMERRLAGYAASKATVRGKEVKSKEEILLSKVGKLALSGLKWKSLAERKDRIFEAMEEYAQQFISPATVSNGDAEKDGGKENDERIAGLEKLLRMADCPEILIKNPKMVTNHPNNDAMNWAKNIANNKNKLP